MCGQFSATALMPLVGAAVDYTSKKAPFGRDVGLDFVFHDARASLHLETNLVLLFDRHGAVHRSRMYATKYPYSRIYRD